MDLTSFPWPIPTPDSKLNRGQAFGSVALTGSFEQEIGFHRLVPV
jgi:hypothetical protein